MSNLRREITFRPAYDKRGKNPKEDFGVHCVDMCWYLHGPKGVVQFVVYTGWYLPHVMAEWKVRGLLTSGVQVLPADVGYHSKEPTYDGQTDMKCHLLGRCYYDGSGVAADNLFEMLLTLGDEAVWERLEGYYHEQFGP